MQITYFSSVSVLACLVNAVIASPVAGKPAPLARREEYYPIEECRRSLTDRSVSDIIKRCGEGGGGDDGGDFGGGDSGGGDDLGGGGDGLGDPSAPDPPADPTPNDPDDDSLSSLTDGVTNDTPDQLATMDKSTLDSLLASIPDVVKDAVRDLLRSAFMKDWGFAPPDDWPWPDSSATPPPAAPPPPPASAPQPAPKPPSAPAGAPASAPVAPAPAPPKANIGNIGGGGGTGPRKEEAKMKKRDCEFAKRGNKARDCNAVDF